jgi:hypothetical protein
MKSKINDSTKVKVRVPKHLYETIKKKLRENEEVGETVTTEAGPEVNEASLPPEIMQAIAQVADFVKDNYGFLGTAVAMIAGAKALAGKIKKDKTDISGITGAEHGF